MSLTADSDSCPGNLVMWTDCRDMTKNNFEIKQTDSFSTILYTLKLSMHGYNNGFKHRHYFDLIIQSKYCQYSWKEILMK